MKKGILILASALLVFTVGCKKKEGKKDATLEKQETTQKDEQKKAPKEAKLKLALEAKSGSKVKGNVVFVEKDGKVTMTAIMDGLSEGTHAIHIHEKSDCSSADGKSTGGHWNPTHQPHGKWGAAEGYHKGDIGNFTADANGNGTITHTTDEWCISCDDDSKNIIGKAIVVHQGVDDFKSQPSGAAGSRISCGAIIQ